MTSRSPSRLALLNILIGLIATVFVTVLFRSTDLDLFLQALPYSPDEPHWPHAGRQPWRLLHDFGTLPGLVLALSATVLLGASFASPNYVRWRFSAFYLFLLMALGPGLVTNIIGKVFCGRPRPDEILQFSGPYIFHYPFQLGTPGKGYSFLCGHCSMGFLFVGLFFLLRGWKRWAALIGGIVFGLLIGVGRVIQGTHFPSDILLDGTAMYILAASISPIASLSVGQRPLAFSRWKVAVGTAVLVVLMMAGFLFSTPVNKERLHRWVEATGSTSARKHELVMPWNDGARNQAPQQVLLDVERGDVNLDLASPSEPLVIRSRVKGFGFPGAGTLALVDRTAQELRYRQKLKGLFWEVHGRFDVSVASPKALRLRVKTGEGTVHLSGLDPGRTFLLSGSFGFTDAGQFFTRHAGGRFVHEARGDPIVLSIQADKVIVR